MSGWFWAGAAIGLAARNMQNKRQQAENLTRLQIQADGLRADPISPPLATEKWFSGQGAFTFGLPQVFVYTNPRHWQGPSAVTLVEDGATDLGMWLVVLQNQNRVMELDRGLSPWIAVVQPEWYRGFARGRGETVLDGPKPILVGGEQGLFAVHSLIEQGRENRRWVAFTTHRGNSYEVIMGVTPHIESMYINAFWTAVASWRWLDEPHATSPIDHHACDKYQRN